MERLMDTQHEDAKYVVRFYKQEMEWKKKNLKGTIEKKDDVYNKGKMKEKANIAFRATIEEILDMEDILCVADIRTINTAVVNAWLVV